MIVPDVERKTDATDLRRRNSIHTIKMEVCGREGRCSRNWFYIPFLNLFIEYFALLDPPTPEELAASLEVTGLVAALFISMLTASTQSYGHDDFVAAMVRHGINVTNGDSAFPDGIDPYSFWVSSTCTSFNAFSGVLVITCVMIFHESSVDFHGPDGEYSVDLRRAWWSYVRVPMFINFMMLAYALYKSTEVSSETLRRNACDRFFLFSNVPRRSHFLIFWYLLYSTVLSHGDDAHAAKSRQFLNARRPHTIGLGSVVRS